MNRATITGRLARDVEVRKTQSGLSVASFTVAVDDDTGKDKPPFFINCVVWRQGAEFLGQYAQKGDMVGVDGKITTRSYQNQNGQKVNLTEVLADKVEILAHKGQNQRNDNFSAPQQNRSQTDWNRSQMRQQPNNNQQSWDAGGLDISSDDLPF